MSVRYNCPQYLDTWRDKGTFPAIHTGIVDLLTSELSVDDCVVLDLGSSTGLLSRRLADQGYVVYPVESSRAAISQGKEYGTYDGLPVTHMRLRSDDMSELADWIAMNGITAVVARRVFPELDDCGIAPLQIGDTFLAAGVQHLFVEGRVPRAGARHRLHCLDKEIAALGPGWTVTTRDGAHRALLRASV